MSNEVTEYLVSRGELLRADNLRPAEVNRLVDAEAYRALEAECERLRDQVQALQSDANSWQSGYDKGRIDGARFGRAERNALAAELAAIRAAGGEQVEVIGFLYEDGDILGKCDMAAGTFSLMASPDFDGNVSKLMTVAQHQRIVAAMAAELAEIKTGMTYRNSLVGRLEAELDAARKQEPVAYVLFRDGEVCYESDDSIVISNTPGDETDLYKWLPVFTIPPLAGKVGVPRELLEALLEVRQRCPLPDWARSRIDAALAQQA